MSYRDERSGRPQQPPLPKPYEFVPLPDSSPATAAPVGHHRYNTNALTGTLTATIVARSPVHVASGLLEQVNDREFPLIKGMFRSNGTPAIPGASLKGCIRSIAEAISHSAVQITKARELSRKYLPSQVLDQLDVAQRIFGTLGYQGMVRFADAPQVAGRMIIAATPPLFRPRMEATDTYFDRGRARGRKFYMHGTLAKGNLPLEACAIDSHFRLHMEFENLTPGELGLVLIALGLGQPQLWPKLGGGKPACLGTIAVIDPAITTLATCVAYKDFDAAPQSTDIPPLLTAAEGEGLVLKPQLDQLASILRWPREDRNCPDRSY